MKKVTLVLLTTFAILFVQGQSLFSENNTNDNSSQFVLSTIDKNQQVIIVIDSIIYKIDNIKEYDIKSKWIESVTVMRGDKTIKIYGNNKEVIIIYTKKKYKKRVLKEINNKNST